MGAERSPDRGTRAVGWAFDGVRLVERGPHAELVQRGGLYADLDQRQFLAADYAREPADALVAL